MRGGYLGEWFPPRDTRPGCGPSDHICKPKCSRLSTVIPHEKSNTRLIPDGLLFASKVFIFGGPLKPCFLVMPDGANIMSPRRATREWSRDSNVTTRRFTARQLRDSNSIFVRGGHSA